MRRRLFRAAPPTSDGLDVGALAPMVDMMTILLVFLLRTWSTEAVVTGPGGAFSLAGTQSEDRRHGGVEVMVSTEAVWVDGERVVALDRVGEDAVIRPVYDRLLALRAPQRVEILCDAGVEWSRLRRVVATVQAAGVKEIGLVGVDAAAL